MASDSTSKHAALTRRTVLAVLAGSKMAAAQSSAGGQILDRRGMRATFADDFRQFDASSTGYIDGRKTWRTTYFGGDRTLPNNREVQWYGDTGPEGSFSLGPNGLTIRAFPKTGLPNGLTHCSGLITTQCTLTQLHGYFEIRARLPRGKGMWPAFWLLPDNGHWPPEIDIMEMLGDAVSTYYVAVHAVPDGKPLDEVTKVNAPDLTAGFHVFGVAWRADRLSFYLDDRLVHESRTPRGLDRPMYMLANLAVGGAGSWPGPAPPDATGVFQIGWMRAWQFGNG